MTSTHSIEKLNGENFYTWRYKMQMILTREEVWTIVNGAETAPGPVIIVTDEEAGTSTTTPVATAAATWIKNDQKSPRYHHSQYCQFRANSRTNLQNIGRSLEEAH